MEYLAMLLLLGIPLVAILIVLERIRQLTARVYQLERDLKEALREVATRSHPVTPAVQPVSSSPVIQKETTAPSVPALQRVPAPSPAPPAPTPIPAPELPPSRTRQEWEAIIGGKLLNRIGALALILGVGFFLKYAFDNNWISEPVRVLIGVAVGALLIFFGARTHNKGLVVFAQGIQGAGIAILYLSVYASFGYYHLVPHAVAFVCMALVTTMAFLVGLRFDSQPTALLGWLGGYLTPLVLATDEANLIGLSIYLAMLAGGIVTLQLKRPNWTLLVPLSVLASACVFLAGWTEYGATDVEQIVGFGFLVVFWAIHQIPVLAHYRLGRSEETLRRVGEIMNTVLFFAAIVVLRFDFESPLTSGIAAGIIALLLGGSFAYLHGRKLDSSIVRRIYAVLTIAAAALGLKLAIAPIPWEIISLSFIAAMFTLVGTRMKIEELWQVACLLFIPVAILLLTYPQAFAFAPLWDYRVLLTLRSLIFLVPAASMIAISVMLHSDQSKDSTGTQAALHAGWVFLLFLFLIAETNDYFRYRLAQQGNIILSAGNQFVHRLALAVLWTFLSATVVVLGVRRQVAAMVWAGMGVAITGVILGVASMIKFDPISQFSLFLNVRSATVVLLLIGVYVITRALRHFDHRIAPDAVTAGRICLALIPLILLSAEAWDAFEIHVRSGAAGLGNSDVVTQLRNQRQLALSGIWLVYSLVLIAIGIFKRLPPVRFMAIGLFAVAILKIFIYDLSYLETLYRIFSFVGLGLILLAVSYAYQRYRDIIFGTKPAKAADGTLASRGQ